MQIDEYVSAEHIFTEYAYFSSFSTAWLKHAEDYVAMISDRLGLGPKSLVVELASNDGYLLQYFVKRGIPCAGHRARGQRRQGRRASSGVETLVKFFGKELRRVSWPPRAAGRPGAGQQRARPGPRPERSSPASRVLLKPTGTVHHRVPAPA